jgi:tripartite-type tricarboxylate transporter receptor subunit TctC
MKVMTACVSMVAIAIGMTIVAGIAAAQSYPVRPVRVVVPSSPGGGTDIIARIVMPRLAERLGQSVIVNNRPGAASIIGNEVVAKASPDGYTLLLGISTITILPFTHKKLPYDVLRDFAPISQTIAAPNIIVVHPSLPVRTTKDLIAFARARPGQLNFGSPGTGSNPHLSMALFNVMSGVEMVHIAYKGSGPAITDLLAGHIVVMTATMLTGMPHVRSGRLRALATTGARRSAAAPDYPTVAESGLPGYEAVQWYGLFAPAGVSGEIIARLQAQVAAVVHMPEIAQKFAADGAAPVGSTPEEFGRYIRAEMNKWEKVVRAARIQSQ